AASPTTPMNVPPRPGTAVNIAERAIASRMNRRSSAARSPRLVVGRRGAGMFRAIVSRAQYGRRRANCQSALHYKAFERVPQQAEHRRGQQREVPVAPPDLVDEHAQHV